ncbi:hypothetical protein Poli38472_003064 [Pythium oligandrum]|uniref:Uncharacterized protein n=1 Tax=Pythium oligandrum TaxID=41045 RepID=A0A8K1C637_PYTOL|nr:hypothetical protein Poli38472_003064 [Pythium oligandrum]|eukprot:TMW57139.1 hypothetical protein Poli38472_003064 [Pythium oligandrum]
MKVYTSVVASALGLTAVIADPSVFRRLATDPISYPDGLTKIPSTDAFHMQPVRAIHARVQSDEPAWDDTKKMFVSKYGADFDAKFRGALDTVNTASVEGALMYVQAEGIDYRTRGSDTTAKCTRKNGMKYVVFYDILIAQTNETLAAYPNAEYGPMLPMDGGQCTPTSTTPNVTFPNECYMINGDNNKPVIGPFVGAGDKSTEPRAPYPNTICKVEYNTNADGTLDSSIDFWANPFTAASNTARANKLVKAYTDLQATTTTSTIIASTAVANFKALPTVASLTSANPPCYKSMKACASAQYGCKRALYSQICTLCTADGQDGCVKKPSDYTYPTLEAATPIPTPAPSTASPMSTLAMASAAMSLVLGVFLL